jgi:hypothetical protein
MKSTNEIKVNDPYSYEKAYGESHSFIEYTKNAGETGQYADNFLINIPKAKIIAGFTGWNIPKWARKAEKGDSNFYIASRSAITNPPPYLSTPHIEINDPNSWEPATTAASLIMKYNKNDIDEIKVNDPTPPLPSNISNQIKDEIIEYIIDLINTNDYYSSYIIYELLSEANNSVLPQFIKDQMVFNNHEILRNGEEILLTFNNQNIVKTQDMIDYIDERPDLKNYLETLIWEFYFEYINFQYIYSECMKKATKEYKKYSELDKYDIKNIVEKIIEVDLNYSTWPEDVFFWGGSQEFQDYLSEKLNKADLINEIKVNDPTKKYIIHSYHNSFPYKEPETISVPPSQIKKTAEDMLLKSATKNINYNPAFKLEDFWIVVQELPSENEIGRVKMKDGKPEFYTLNMNEIKVNNPISTIQFNLPADLDELTNVDEFFNYIIDEIAELNPKIDERILRLDSGLYSDVDDAVGDRDDLSIKEMTDVWLYWLCLNLQYFNDPNPDKSTEEINKEIIEAGKFAKNAINGKWVIYPGVTEISWNKSPIRKNVSEGVINETETAYHGSTNYFTSFKKEGIGGGTGSQVYGWGLYFGKNLNTAKGYTSTNAKKTKTLFQGKTPEELGLEYENEIFFALPRGLKTSQEYIEYAQDSIELIDAEPEFEGKEDLIRSYEQFIDIIKDLEVEQEPMSYLYKVTLFPSKTAEYMNWDLNSTPQNQVDKINKQAQSEGWEGFNVSSNMSPQDIYAYINEYIIKNKKNKYPLGTDPQITFKAGHDTSMFLVRAGIDGNTHGNGGVRIVFDDRQIQIDKIYKAKDIASLKENKKLSLNEYSEKVIKQMTDKFQREMKNTLSADDIKTKLNRFDQIKPNLPAKIKSGQIVMPDKFVKPDPKTKKVLNPQDILNYTWKDLETVLDAYGGKAEKTSKDFQTVQDAEFVEVKGAPVVYNGNGIKIYEGSDYGSCVKLNYVFKYKGEDDKIYSYGFCIGRKEEASNQYYTYRFGRGGGFRSFYFVADYTQDANIKGNPSDRNNFENWYHFFIIHAFDNDKFGITDAVNQYGTNHELTGNDKGVSWEEIGQFMIKNGGESGKKAWDKIKNLKDVFKYVPPSDEETDQALVRDKILNFEQFKTLNRNQKRVYITRRADQPNAFNSEMFGILDVDLKNLALRTGSGFKPTYNDIKDNNALSRSYARFRLTRALDDYKNGKSSTTVVPLPFVQYLNDDEKKEYIDNFDDNISPDLIRKYFGDEVANEYINDTAKKLNYLPKEDVKYIKDPKLKSLYELLNKLNVSWKEGETTKISDEELANQSSMPEQVVDPKPLYLKGWQDLSATEKKVVIALIKKYNGKKEYRELIFSLPFLIKDGANEYIFAPINENPDNEGQYDDWVLVDMNGKVVKKILGDSLLGGIPINSGYPNVFRDFNRIYDIKDLTE